MKKLKDHIVYGSVGATCSAVGLLSVSRCTTGNCLSCFGCAGIGLGVIIVALINIIAGRKRGNRELAKGTD